MTARHIAILITMFVVSLPATIGAQSVPLASGGVPPCSAKRGLRHFRSATAWDNGSVAFITGSALREKSACRSIAQIHLERGTKANTIALPDADRKQFAIIDFSPDGKELLLSAETHQASPNEQLGYLEIGTLPLSRSEIRWRSVWDILGWKDCDAAVEALGFTADGKIALNARPSVMASPRRSNCVSAPKLYAIDQTSGAISLITAADIKHYGKTVSPPTQACKSDPDLVGKCFTVHGRISGWNGNPTFRIHPAATKQLLGVSSAPFPLDTPVLPELLEGKLNMDTEAAGDFYVCPLSAEKPGHMQMVCLEAASSVTFKRR